MCNQCNQHEMELLPELEALIGEEENNFFPSRQYRRHRHYDDPNRQYEYEYETGSSPTQPAKVPAYPKPQITQDCPAPAAKLIPKHFEPELASCIRTKVLSERTQFLLNLSRAERGPNWVKQIKPGVDLFKIFPKVDVSVELWQFIPIAPGNPDLLVSLKSYLQAQSQYYSSIVAEISLYKTIENGLQIPFTGLFQKAGVDPTKLTPEEKKSYIILAYVTYPDNVKDYLRKPEFSNLDKFEFDKSTLLPDHLSTIKTIGYDIFDSYFGQKYVTGVTIIGHTDERGSDDYNFKLGKKRADAVEKQIRLELENNAPVYFKSTVQKIKFTAGSKGKKQHVSTQHELNRRVEVAFQYTVVPKLKPLNLDAVIQRCLQLLNQKRIASDPQVQRERCLLQKMQVAGTDDRFISGGQTVLNISNRNRFPAPDEWNRVRYHLTNPNLFGNRVDDTRVLASLDWLDEQIINAKPTINQIVGTQGGATAKAIEQLLAWLHGRLQDKTSIYTCYKKVF